MSRSEIKQGHRATSATVWKHWRLGRGDSTHKRHDEIAGWVSIMT